MVILRIFYQGLIGLAKVQVLRGEYVRMVKVLLILVPLLASAYRKISSLILIKLLLSCGAQVKLMLWIDDQIVLELTWVSMTAPSRLLSSTT
jgi:hypothetical protein